MDQDKKMLELFQNTYNRYLKHAEALKGEEFDTLKILNYLKALRFLSKLKKNSDVIEDKQLMDIGNRVLGIITRRIFSIDKQKNIETDYTLLKERSNLAFAMARVYSYLEDWKNSIHWLKKCKKLISKVINGVLFDKKHENNANLDTLPLLIKNLIIHQAKLSSYENKYKIDELLISNSELFGKYAIINERIEVLSAMKEVVSEFKDIEEKTKDGSEYISKTEKTEVYINLTREVQYLCDFLKNKLILEYDKDSIERQKVLGNILFRRYSIVKTLKELKIL